MNFNQFKKLTISLCCFFREVSSGVVEKFRRPDLSDRPATSGKAPTMKSGPKEVVDISNYFERTGQKLVSVLDGGVEQYRDKHVNYLIAEMQQLRAEIVNIKERELRSESFIVGAVSVLYAAYFKELVGGSVFILIVPILAGAFGFIRLREYQRNILNIDSYIRENEFLFSSRGGWVHYFFAERNMEKYFQTQVYFWILYGVIATIIFVAAATGFITPSPIKLEFVNTSSLSSEAGWILWSPSEARGQI